ncbi:MAG: LysM peptidoglycan-binding domain-containing protein [Nitrospira sp.]|uniref:LysM domain-containing protein n=1 Tax=Nitrospira defluvii TaxID=330214 RepID=A0ABM8S051_9BACT|nr:LysM domain-containing protein [Nitrospira defluvii]MCS6329750.1 LysM peptidoglycan-binding domain-containing protein [Nitrospira sp.]CAE6781342.1 LysM domain-containing protein [Nitrospira defluvii]
MMTERGGSMKQAAVRSLGLLVLCSMGLSGCVMSEKYEAEKARSLNFQRLLAQEEKRSAELDNEVKRSRRELSEYEARNRELNAQVEAVRQQAAQIQEEAQAMKEASLLEKRAQEDMKRLTTIPSKAKKAAPKKDFAAAVDEALKAEVPTDLSLEPAKDSAKDLLGHAETALESAGAAAASLGGTTHTVRPGETLYRIGQKYHVGLDQLRKWNNMTNNTVVVGQKLVVSQP